MIKVLDIFGFKGEWYLGLIGVWLEGWKVGVIGIKVSCWIIMYGFVFNVFFNLEGF